MKSKNFSRMLSPFEVKSCRKVNSTVASLD